MLNFLATIFAFFAKLWLGTRKPPTDTKTQQTLEKAQDDEQQARTVSEKLASDAVAAGTADPGRVLDDVNEAINDANRKL